MIGRSGERGSGISVLAARHDDDDDDNSNNICKINNINYYANLLKLKSGERKIQNENFAKNKALYVATYKVIMKPD